MIYLIKDDERAVNLRIEGDDKLFRTVDELTEWGKIAAFPNCETSLSITTDFPDSDLPPWKYVNWIKVGSNKHIEGKVRPTLVPVEAIVACAAVMTWGIEKKGYKQGAWRGVDAEKWEDAAFRHWIKYLEDRESVDSESGMPHLWHLLFNIAVLIGNGGGPKCS